MTRHRLVVLNPGHFHAALTLREAHPRLDETVHVYAEDGPDVDRFLAIVRAFNERAERPTRWDLRVTRGPDFFERLLTDRPGNLVVTAGRNDRKLAWIHRLHAEGFAVLADKPWLIDEADLPLLAPTLAGAPLAMDLMTNRHIDHARLMKALTGRPDLFGTWRTDGTAISIAGVHNLYKTVNGAPLVRPPWYFDTRVQGEGISDVTSHPVDLSQWLVGDGTPFDADGDTALTAAEQWPTRVPRDWFTRITGLDRFPDTLPVAGDALDYLCNARFRYTLRGVPVAIESLWALTTPGGDSHETTLRGTGATITDACGPATDFVSTLTITPETPGAAFAEALRTAAADLDSMFPGLAIAETDGAYRLIIPDALRTTHEQHFAKVLDQFLAYVDTGTWPPELGPNTQAKYTLLARARALSHA